MAHRRISSANGVEWDVYDVVIPATSPRVGQPQLAPPASTQIPVSKMWLCFESKTDRRRLSPIPEGWDNATDAELLVFLARAAPVGKSK